MNKYHLESTGYLEWFGQWIKIHRLFQGITLRDLSKTSQLSHTLLNKLEHANARLTEESYDRITYALHIKHEQCEQRNARFEELESVILQAILLGETDRIVKPFQELEFNERYYLSSFLVCRYVLLFVSVYNRPHHQKYHKTSRYIQVLSELEKEIPQDLLVRLYFARGIYQFYNTRFNEAINDLTIALELELNPHLVGFIKYYLGRAYSDSYQLSIANRLFDEATQIFHRFHNINRSMHTKVYIAINLMRVRNFKQVKELFDEIKVFAQRSDLKGLLERVWIHEMLYLIMIKDYHGAIHMQDVIKFKTEQYYFYLIYAAYALEDFERVQSFYKDSSKEVKKDGVRRPVYKLGMDLLYYQTMDSEAAEKKVKGLIDKFFNETIQHSFYIEGRLAYEMYKTYLLERRQYKKAYEITMKMVETKGKVSQ